MQSMCAKSCIASRAHFYRGLLHKGCAASASIAANAVARIVGELYRDGGVVLCRGVAKDEVWSFPSLVLDPGVHFHVLAQPLHGVYGKVVLGGSLDDEVLGGFHISILKFEPFIAAEAIGEPCLAAFRLATDPVAEYVSLVGVGLPLNRLPVHEAASEAACRRRIGRGGFRA